MWISAKLMSEIAVNEWWTIVVWPGRRLRPRHWRAAAGAVRRDTGRQVGQTFAGLGDSRELAELSALERARLFVLAMGDPPER